VAEAVDACPVPGGRRTRAGLARSLRSNVASVIPLPLALLLTSAMLVGTAVGLVAGIASMLLVTATIRPDVVIALVVGVPSAIGLLRVRARSVTLTVFGNRG
jgi:Putative holin